MTCNDNWPSQHHFMINTKRKVIPSQYIRPCKRAQWKSAEIRTVNVGEMLGQETTLPVTIQLLATIRGHEMACFLVFMYMKTKIMWSNNCATNITFSETLSIAFLKYISRSSSWVYLYSVLWLATLGYVTWSKTYNDESPFSEPYRYHTLDNL